MRHVLSLVLALILTPLIYLSAGYSAVKFGDANALADLNLAAAGLGLAAALAAGGLYALLVMARLSPFGPVLAGLIYFGVTLWDLLGFTSFTDAMPGSVFGVAGVLTKPAGAGTALLAVPLLCTIFSPRRWRSRVQPGPAVYQAAPTYPAYSGSGVSAAPTYQDTAVAAPMYEPPVYVPPPPVAAEPPTLPGS